MKKGFFLLAIVAVLFTACQKDKIVSLRTEGIAKGSWRVKARDTASSTTPGVIGYDTVSVLERITRYRFLSNGDMARISTFMLDTFQVSDSIISGQWALRLADTRLTLTDPNIAGDYHFVGYDDSTMLLQLVIPNGETDSTTITTTLLRQ